MDTDAFLSLTGNRPLSWQVRLYQHFSQGRLPATIELPTGLGKTMVIVLWLIARTRHPDKVPTRLIYVVDRRTVVDQATDLAEEFAYLLSIDPARNFAHVEQRKPALAERRQKYAAALAQLRAQLGHDLVVSTLRGQLADNREWSRDPSRPAIVIGTVDLIGSGLLFSGYRSSYKRRPLEAGLLGQDALLVLDEAHLSRPFEKLVCALDDAGPFQKDRRGNAHGNPLRVIRMSATRGESSDVKPPFTLQFDDDGKLAGDDAKDPTIIERFSAAKTLSIVEADSPAEAIAAQAAQLAIEKPGSRIVVFVKSPDLVKKVCDALGRKCKEHAPRMAQLTGTMRGLERDELVAPPTAESQHARHVMQRFLNPDNDASQGNCFLVSTSAGEVGFDLNADHMVCDETTIDSLIQRLGRVNRRGGNDCHATVILVRPQEPTEKNEQLQAAILNTRKLLADGMSLSPQSIATLKAGEWQQLDTGETRSRYELACAPQPATVELTDFLLDAWSLTSITEPMPGRPDVGPWLRGIADEQAQTTIAWRAEIDLFCDGPLPEAVLAAVFAKHPIRPHESLAVNTGYLLEFLKKISKLKNRPPDLMTTKVAVRLPRGQIEVRTLQQVSEDPGILYAESTLILPARFGGLDNAGMLDADSIPSIRKAGEPPPRSLDVADYSGYEQSEVAGSRLRIILERAEDGSWTPKPLPGLSIPADIKLEPNYDTSTGVFTALRTMNLRVRLVQPIQRDEEGDPVQSLVILAPAPIQRDQEDQLLIEHVGAVEAWAKRIAQALRLADDDPLALALRFAARWHDEGKKADVWQRFVYGPDAAGAKGKSSRCRDPKALRGYRHEFGSLLRIYYPERTGTEGCVVPDDHDARELGLHLIATHHGLGRPHFPPAFYHEFTDAERDEVHVASIRRFAQLQRQYGWWRLAWLENLLRCADALASADDEVTEIDETEGGAP